MIRTLFYGMILKSGRLYQRKFKVRQDDLLTFIDGDSEIMPQTPEFINTLLGA